MTDEEQHRQKEVEHYAASVGAWFNTRLELDKSLLTLSSGGIGLLLTLMSAFGIHSIESLVLYVLSLISFVVSLAAVLSIFSRNGKHLEDVLRDGTRNDPWLDALDKIAVSAFLAGVVFSLIIGIAGAMRSYVTQEKSMSSDEKKSVHIIAQDSFNRAAILRPTAPDPMSKSFNGAARMKPEQPVSAQSQSTQNQQGVQQSQPTQQGGGSGAKAETKNK